MTGSAENGWVWMKAGANLRSIYLKPEADQIERSPDYGVREESIGHPFMELILQSEALL